MQHQTNGCAGRAHFSACSFIFALGAQRRVFDSLSRTYFRCGPIVRPGSQITSREQEKKRSGSASEVIMPGGRWGRAKAFLSLEDI